MGQKQAQTNGPHCTNKSLMIYLLFLFWKDKNQRLHLQLEALQLQGGGVNSNFLTQKKKGYIYVDVQLN